jgi:hypothetical protein
MILLKKTNEWKFILTFKLHKQKLAVSKNSKLRRYKNIPHE